MRHSTYSGQQRNRFGTRGCIWCDQIFGNKTLGQTLENVWGSLPCVAALWGEVCLEGQVSREYIASGEVRLKLGREEANSQEFEAWPSV